MTLVAVAVAMMVGAFLKGVTGMGLPPIAIPVLAGVVGIERAVIIMAIPTAVTNAWLVWRYRDHFGQTRRLPTLVGTGTVAAVAGAWLLVRIDERPLALIVAALVGAYVVALLRNPDMELSGRTARVATAPVGVVGGALQGATGLSGAVLATYLHALRLPQAAFVLSISLLFLVFALGQAGGLVLVGRYTPAVLAESLLATAFAMVFLPLGSRLAPRLSRQAFDRVVLAVLVLSSAKLVYDAFAA